MILLRNLVSLTLDAGRGWLRGVRSLWHVPVMAEAWDEITCHGCWNETVRSQR